MIRVTMLSNCSEWRFRLYEGNARVVDKAPVIVGHLAPDLDCITAIWILIRFGDTAQAQLAFVPSGMTLHNQPVDSSPHIIHVDTGGGRYDHHQRKQSSLSAAELVRRAMAPYNLALQRLVDQVTAIDHGREKLGGGPLHVQALVDGLNQLFPDQPQAVVSAMLPNLDAWHASEARQIRLENAFQHRIEFQSAWGPGIALESADGGSSRLAFKHGAVLHVYRDSHGWMGAVARAQSQVDFSQIYYNLQTIDPGADWYLHPSHRLLLCGSAKAPAQKLSQLSLQEFVNIIAK